jgi:hypothetical protein
VLLICGKRRVSRKLAALLRLGNCLTYSVRPVSHRIRAYRMPVRAESISSFCAGVNRSDTRVTHIAQSPLSDATTTQKSPATDTDRLPGGKGSRHRHGDKAHRILAPQWRKMRSGGTTPAIARPIVQAKTNDRWDAKSFFRFGEHNRRQPLHPIDVIGDRRLLAFGRSRRWVRRAGDG